MEKVMSINCKDLPWKNYYRAENGHVRVDSLTPTATMFVSREGNKITISGTNWDNDMSFDISDSHTMFKITSDSFNIYDIRYPMAYSRSISGVAEHNKHQLDELAKLLAAR